jgi:hypothetical protein
MYEQYVGYFETITCIIFLTGMVIDGFLKIINGYTEQSVVMFSQSQWKKRNNSNTENAMNDRIIELRNDGKCKYLYTKRYLNVLRVKQLLTEFMFLSAYEFFRML